MKLSFALLLFVFFSVFASSCILDPDVQCICKTGTVNNIYDLGKQYNPSDSVNMVKCDTIAKHNNWGDTCRIEIPR